MSPVRTWDDFAGLDPEARRRHLVFSAHLMDSLEPYVGMALATVTLLRDPIERTVSHYAHVARDAASPLHALAARLSFAEFCRHPDARRLIENYQARQLAGRFDDPVRLAAGDGEAARLGVAATLERLLAERFRDEATLHACARARLAACVAVGVTERLSDTIGAFADALGLERPRTIPFENFSYNRPGRIDAETRALIAGMTRVDAALHREAAALLDARMAALRVGQDMPQRRARGERIRVFVRGWMPKPGATQRAKILLSDLLRAAPLEMRAFLSRFYVGYRILIDRRVDWRSRLPLALGLLYLPQPVDLIPATVPVFGWLDNLTAVWVGCAIAVAHVDKRIMSDIRHAAAVRFDLPPHRERRRR